MVVCVALLLNKLQYFIVSVPSTLRILDICFIYVKISWNKLFTFFLLKSNYAKDGNVLKIETRKNLIPQTLALKMFISVPFSSDFGKNHNK